MRAGCWVPPIEECNSLGNWKQYQERIYSIFKQDFIDSVPLYESVNVNIKHYPIEYGKEEAFYHVTCKDYNNCGDRVPDLRRCERIRWVRAFIENNCNLMMCEECEGIKTWRERYKNKTRVHILLEEEKYMVVLEHRPQTENHKEYFLLITAFYFDYDNALKKQLNHYEQSK